MSAKYTPMLEQYLEIKNQHPDALLFFRLGDFYEMFFEDARVASRELEIVLTSREGGANERVPMCGVPHHSAHTYLAKLIARGYRVAICEQVEDPREAKGLVKREVVRIITPGTVIEENMLPETADNYLAAVHVEDQGAGLAFADISTGEFRICQWTGPQSSHLMQAELMRIQPAECLIAEGQPFLWAEEAAGLMGFPLTRAAYPGEYQQAHNILLRHFQAASLRGFGITEEHKLAIIPAAAVISYLKQVCKEEMLHLQSIRIHDNEQFLSMDPATRRNLELTCTLREGKREGSLLARLDYCCTSMGRRRLKKWIQLPLRDIEMIQARQKAVQELKDNLGLRMGLREALDQVYDLERLAGRLGSQIASPRDLLAVKNSLGCLNHIKSLLQEAQSQMLKEIAALDPLEEAISLIDQAIDEQAPLSVKEGDIIKEGYQTEIDELRLLSREGSAWLIEFENREKERTGIKYLKVGYNKVFGYYIEISKSNLHLVPADYHRKQTLVNTERFISDELKHYEDRITGARERLYRLEYEEFCHIRERMAQYLPRLNQTAELAAVLDCLVSLGEAAYADNYVCPHLDHSGVIEVKGGRHPVVEKSLTDSRFVPNDVKLNLDQANFAIITGPNMGGKSTYMRQTALLAVMAQMGSFVPAESARIGMVDRLFTRVGAADDLSAGQSTFMVEMVEVAYILNNATRHSLILLDEIGRGTSTYDGLSLAQAVTEHIVNHIGARTLFATHYHELTRLEETLPGVYNLSVSVKDTGDTVVFLKRVLPGKADRSYGLHVAQMAGVSRDVIQRAQQLLESLENSGVNQGVPRLMEQPGLFSQEQPLLEKLQRLDLDRLSPREALLLLYEWKKNLT